MRVARRGLAILAALAWGVAPAGADTPARDAERAIGDLMAHYWVGNAESGHIAYGCPKPGGCMWEGAQVAQALYGWWRISGSRDAATRFAAHWAWLKSVHPPADFTQCGHESEENYASDDTAWDANLLMEAAEVTHDATALALARGALDCARRRWWDTQFDGGYHYSDRNPGKSNYQAVLILDELEYFRQSGDAAYLAQARQDEAWMATHLLVTPALSRWAPAGIGLYFNYFKERGCHGQPGPVDCVYHMRAANLNQTQTMLVANMAMCIVDARLWKITGDQQYRRRMLLTAEAIRRDETNAGNPYPGALDGRNVITDDQDPNVDGYAAVGFVREVLPLLPRDPRFPDAALFRATAAAIMANDRTPDGLYGGDWQGPVAGNWTLRGHNNGPDRMVVSANAVLMVVAAAGAK